MNTSVLRQHAQEIFQAGLRAVDPIQAIQRHVTRHGSGLRVGPQSYELDSYERVLVVGAGKAGAAMSQGLEAVLGDRITMGWVNVKHGHLLATKTIALVEAGHPLPDAAGVEGTFLMMRMLASAGPRDLVFCLLSGGGSALLPAPAPGISLAQKQAVTQLLLDCGATIQEINTIRKHLSAIKGGQLARLGHPASLVTLILSDVIGDPLDMIASGPTVPDTTTFGDSLAIIERYGLTDRIPQAAVDRIRSGVEGKIAETPKQGDPVFEHTQDLIIASNALAAYAAAQRSKDLGYPTTILSTSQAGETRDVAKAHAALIKDRLAEKGRYQGPVCLISGGETTVTIRGKGLGGRNQEFVLAASLEMEGFQDVVVFSAGTDGTDGPTDAAGAIADGQTVDRARQLGLDPLGYLNRNDSYRFFEPLGDLIKTGPTHTNVMDLHILLIGKMGLTE